MEIKKTPLVGFSFEETVGERGHGFRGFILPFNARKIASIRNNFCCRDIGKKFDNGNQQEER